jgi:hypothetical protein
LLSAASTMCRPRSGTSFGSWTRRRGRSKERGVLAACSLSLSTRS